MRRPYGDPFWRSFWPPLHFNCRTTVRAIYDERELDEEPITAVPADAEAHRSPGWGAYPLDNDRWWEELPGMRRRARAYGVQGMIDAARESLVEEKSEPIKIPDTKLTQYALNPEHPVGKHKAKVFESALGYTLDNHQDLIDNVYRNIDESKFVPKGNHGHGMRYEQILELVGPNGNKAKVLTAWIETDGKGKGKRLTTIYVLTKESDE